MRRNLKIRIAVALLLGASIYLGAVEAPPPGATGARAAIPPKLAAEDFSRFKIVGGIALSPDGKTMAYEISQGNDWILVFHDWETGKILKIPKGANGTTPVWVNQERVIYGYGSSIDRSGKDLVVDGLEHYRRRMIFARFPGDKSDEILATFEGLPELLAVNVRRGSFREVEKATDHVIGWLVDGTGFVRVAVQSDKDWDKKRVLVRADAKSPWVVAAGLDFANDDVRALWLSGDGKLLYLSRPTPEGTRGVYSYDLEKQQLKELILSHTLYDIFPAGEATLAPKTREILGFDYVTDRQRSIWFDPQMAAIQTALDQALPNRINEVTSLSDDLQRVIVFSSSARDPGKYLRFDLAKQELRPLLPILPWIKPAQMAEVSPISYPARDGLVIHGYLTLPVGREPKNLPLIVCPHSDLHGRDTWRFNLDTQFLANRGYAVLQVNYRGSAGYGRAFEEKSYRQIGRKVQDDITDGARWAIAQGVADPGRIAIMGAGFGGYSALIGVVQNPSLYRCAINISGNTDWTVKKKLIKKIGDTFKEQIGDPEKDAAELADISPLHHVDKLTVPLFLVYDNIDDYYADAYDDFKAFLHALDKAHCVFESLDRHNDFTGFASRKNRIEMLTRLEGFLEKHMPADTGAAPKPSK